MIIVRHKKIKSCSTPRTIYTSYFSKVGGENRVEEKLVAISLGIPGWWAGRIYEDLAPSAGLLALYKNMPNFIWDRFAEGYKRETLRRLDPFKVANDIGEDSIMVCWEGPGKFCHRHVVAEWLMNNVKGLEVREL